MFAGTHGVVVRNLESGGARLTLEFLAVTARPSSAADRVGHHSDSDKDLANTFAMLFSSFSSVPSEDRELET